jgi:hypothetical protein
MSTCCWTTWRSIYGVYIKYREFFNFAVIIGLTKLVKYLNYGPSKLWQIFIWLISSITVFWLIVFRRFRHLVNLRIMCQHCVAAFGLEYFRLSDNDTLSSLFLILEWQHINWSQSPKLKEDGWLWDRYQNFVQKAKFMDIYCRTLIISSLILLTSYKSDLFLWPAWLGRRQHLPVLLIYYPATILAKHKVSVARIPIMQAKKFTIYTKHSMPTRQHELALKAWFHRRFFSAKCEIFCLFLLNCEQSSRNNLFEYSQFKRKRRNISRFAEKKRPWNQDFRVPYCLAQIISTDP